MFSLQDVFDYPTVKTLCDFIESADKNHISYDLSDFADIHKSISENIDDGFIPEETIVGNVLITGVTGFLGMHILDEYLKSENGIAYCLVRGSNIEESKKRFKEKLNYYFDDKYNSLIDSRIQVVCGDVEKDNLGIEELPVETIIHSAASVKHFGSYKYFYNINVGGTVNVMNYAEKVNAKMIHISTLSVSGNSMADIFDGYRSDEYKEFFENNLYIGQPVDNVYIRSKFEAEREILKRVADGFRANIIRVGNLTNRISDLKFQPNYESNAFLNRVRALLGMRVFPDYLMDLYCEFSAIDDTARAVMTIAKHFSSRRNVFHVNSHKVVYFDTLFKYLKECGIVIDVLDGHKFNERLKHFNENPETQYVYEALINDMDENGKLIYDSNIHIENEMTVKYLERLGFEWSEITFEYIRGWIEYFKNLGYLEV